MIQFLLWGMSKILIIVFVLSGPAMITFLLIALLIPWGSANITFRFPGKKADFLTLKVPTIHELLRSHRSHQGKLPTQPGNHSDITLYPKSSTIRWFATSHQRHSQSKQPLVCWIPVTSDTPKAVFTVTTHQRCQSVLGRARQCMTMHGDAQIVHRCGHLIRQAWQCSGQAKRIFNLFKW